MTQSNVKIAITGGIGSGKSTVAEIIRRQGYAVFSCDEIYNELLQNAAFVNKLAEEFDGVLTPDGAIDRIKLSEKVFSDKSALKRLNALTHPAVMYEVLKKSEGHNLSFAEVPLLFENGYEKFFDGVIVVLRDEEERISSVIKRDKIDREKVILRIKLQFNYSNDDFAKYYVMHNCGNFDDLAAKTYEIVENIKAKYL